MGLVAPRHVGSSRSRDHPMSPALAGRFFTTESPRKPLNLFFFKLTYLVVVGLSHGMWASP